MRVCRWLCVSTLLLRGNRPMTTAQASPQDLRQVVESFYADICNRNDTAKVPLLLTPGFTLRGSVGPTVVGHDGFIAYASLVNNALGDYHCSVLDLVVDPPRVSARIRNSGLHKGELYGWLPSGKMVHWASTALFTFEGWQIDDLCVMGDLPGLTSVSEADGEHFHHGEH